MQSPLAFSKLFLKKKIGKKSLNFKLRQIDPSIVQERFSLMSIYLSQNQYKDAEILFNRTWKTNPLDIKSQDNIDLVNAFIKCHLSTSSQGSQLCKGDGNIQRAWDWYQRIKEIGSSANVETFGILINALINKREIGKIKELLDEFQKSNLSIDKLLKFNGIQENFFELKALVSDFTCEETESYKNDLLKSVLKDEYSDKISLEEEAEEYLLQVKGRTKDAVQSGAIGVKILQKTLGELQSSTHVTDYEKQLWLEERAHAAALEEVEEFMKKLPDSIRKITHLPSDLVWAWNQKLEPAIQERIKVLEEGIDEKSCTKTTFLKLLPVSTLSRITIAEFLKIQSKRDEEGDGTIKEKAGLRKALNVVMGIGKSIEREHNLRQFKKNKGLINTNVKLHKLHSNGKLFNITVRSIAKELHESHGLDWMPFWPNKTLVDVCIFSL
jgi:pentatricopeptide repeat protein